MGEDYEQLLKEHNKLLKRIDLLVRLGDRQQGQLRKLKDAAETANLAKSEFIASMSHELRTPLNGILGFTQILKRDKSLNPQQRDAVNTIEQSGRHLLILINDVLDMSKIEAGKMELHLHDFHFSNFLKSIIDIIQIQAKHKNIEFQSEINVSLPTAVNGDETRLRQLLVNLLGNAVKFTEQGFVNFRVSYCEHTSNPSQEGIEHAPSFEDKIRFEIEDSGPGIKTDELETIFEPFKQVGAQRYMTEGTGLGLPLCKKLVKMMGGTLGVKSTFGKGSLFWFDLVLPSVEGWYPIETSQTEPRIIGYKGKPRRILIVDDKNENRGFLFELLSSLEFDIAEAFNGDTAIEIALPFQPDVIFMDLLMPVMDGIEATRRIRQIAELTEVIIIAISANVSDETQKTSSAAGCNDFIAKPFTTEEVLEKLGSQLKLEWEYDIDNSVQLSQNQGESEKTEQPIVKPPAEMVKMLTDLAMLGDIKSIINKIEQLEHTDSKFAPFIAQVRQLAEGFQIQELNEYLESFFNQDGIEPALVEPPTEMIKMLYDLAMMGDVESITEQIDQLEKTDSQFAWFADQVRPLAEGFQVRKISELLESFLNKKDS
ncbi:MAG: hypothetical protein DRR19_20910 [Candidatus Parabeggiatoa sp. nov. 1]|nr:MAG: hypothetical protein DRR19_20910 [Gammaproteobacteria bacterium]